MGEPMLYDSSHGDTQLQQHGQLLLELLRESEANMELFVLGPESQRSVNSSLQSIKCSH